MLPLVEVIAGSSSTQTLHHRGDAVCRAIEKNASKGEICERVLVNRALLPYLFEAIEVMVSGEAQDKLDQALIRFGMPMGPIELCDQIGLDVCFDVGQVLACQI